ncbi:MAG: cell wall hydrolase/autolysin [Bacteroidota bacterium]|jgi:N-acetylmuramoyl-L-alanine amidase
MQLRLPVFFLLLPLFSIFLSTAFVKSNAKPDAKLAAKPKVAARKTLLKTIVIDAGHGGKDPGCAGNPKTESKVTLGVALKLGAYIEANLPDIKVVYTRKTDKFIELYERANIANRNNADLFISIHCNSMPIGTGKTVKGTEVYVMGMHVAGENLDIAKKMADRENKSILLEKDYKKHYDGYDPNDPATHILLTMKQNVHLDQSIKVAQSIIDESKKLSRSTRGVHQAGFVVIRATTMPSILVETGYLSNKEENAELQSEKGQSRMAKAIFRAVKAYKNDLEGKKKDDGSDPEIDPEGNPDINKPDINKPDINKPGINKPDINKPGINKPDLEAPKPENEPQTSGGGNSSNTNPNTSSEQNPPTPAKTDTRNTKKRRKGKQKETEIGNDSAPQTIPINNNMPPISNTEGTVYRIQIVSNDKQLSQNSILLRGLTDIQEDFSDNRYRYLVGNYTSLSAAAEAAQQYKLKGYKGAFPVRFVNGKRAK